MTRSGVLVLLAALLTAPAWGWGSEGHQAICEIAFLELDPATRQAVRRLIRQDERYRTLRVACTWPDTPGRLQDARRPEHYVNVPRGQVAVTEETCPLARRCLFTALARDASILRSAEAPTRERVIALRSLGHWVGDLHQPLHVSYLDDHGGNDVPVSGIRDSADNLHAFWDVFLPRRLMRTLGADTPGELAESLRERITPEQRAAWRRDPDFAAWAGESLRIVRDRDTGYCQVREDVCLPRSASAGPLTPADLERHEATAALRLEQAGVRLAALLERLLGGE